MTLTLGFSAVALYVLIGVSIFILFLDFISTSAEAQEASRGTLTRLSLAMDAFWPLSLPVFACLVLFSTFFGRD